MKLKYVIIRNKGECMCDTFITKLCYKTVCTECSSFGKSAYFNNVFAEEKV